MNETVQVALVIVAVMALGVLMAVVARQRDAGAAQARFDPAARRRDQARRPGPHLPASRPDTREVVAAPRSGSSQLEPPPATAPPVPWTPPDADAVGMQRRRFLNRSIIGLTALSTASFGSAVVAFLWPRAAGGFGGVITPGGVDDVRDAITTNNGFLYQPSGRLWITEYPAAALQKASEVYTETELVGMEAGFVALFQKCPHLGCRVPQCVTSQWFECPCHGSQYNRVGEKMGGPAPRGLDRFPVTVVDGTLTIDTSTIIQGPPIGTDTTSQAAEGPHCVTGGEAE
jgi:cytochrome b6-f complex iron-sulfur subunit